MEGNTSANTFVLAAYVQVLNHSANSVGATFPINVNVSYGTVSLYSTVNITIASTPTRSLNQVFFYCTILVIIELIRINHRIN